MCLILFAYHSHPEYPLIIAGNRDEFYNRSTATLSFWEDEPDLLAGRDLMERGTWLGITRTGRIGVITNYRDPAEHLRRDATSRGLLLRRFLTSPDSPMDFLEKTRESKSQFCGFNLLAGDPNALWYYSSKTDEIQPITPGIHGLSNHLLNSPWPKVEKGKAEFEKIINSNSYLENKDFFNVLTDRTVPPDEDLPNTGITQQWERMLAPIFITSKIYGTRSSSVIIVKKDKTVAFSERTYGPATSDVSKGETCQICFKISDHVPNNSNAQSCLA